MDFLVPNLAPIKVGFFLKLSLKFSALMGARNYLDLEPSTHTFVTLSLEKKSHSAQERVRIWLTKVNESNYSRLEDLENRIQFINGRLTNLKSAETGTKREASSNYAKISQSHGELLDKLALKAQITEAIVANNELAEAAIETWQVFFEKQTAIYFEALHRRARRILRKPKSEPQQEASIPPFEGLLLSVRDGFAKKMVSPKFQTTGEKK